MEQVWKTLSRKKMFTLSPATHVHLLLFYLFTYEKKIHIKYTVYDTHMRFPLMKISLAVRNEKKKTRRTTIEPTTARHHKKEENIKTLN